MKSILENMSITYPAQYKDQFGSESIIVVDDNRAIRLSLRGVEFSGGYFSLSAVSEINAVSNQRFQFFEDELCAYSLDFELPIIVISKGRELETKLHVQMERGKPIKSTGWTVWHRRNDGRIEQETEHIDNHMVSLEIKLDQSVYRSSGPYSDFEGPLIELSKQFPSEVYLKICLNCQLSEYPPSIASGLRCFRNAKNELKQVKGKWDFLELWSEKGIKVDETYLCPEFEKRSSKEE